MNEEKQEGERVSLRVTIRQKDVQTIQAVIREAEREVGVSSQAIVEESQDRFIPGLDVLLVGIAIAFATKFAERFGESFADWLARKLGLDENKGEKVSESR